MSEPIQDCSELNEGEEGRCELVIAGRDPAEAFDAAEEVFHSVAASIVASVEPMAPGSSSFGSDACPNVSGAKRRVESVCIEAAIGDSMLVSEYRHQRKDRLEVVLLTGSEAELNRSTQRVDHGGKLRIDAALRSANRLERLSTPRVGPVLVKLDVRAIEMPQLPRRLAGKLFKEPLPKATRTPSSPSSVDRAPRTKAGGQISPRHSGAKHKPDRRDHKPVVFSRATSNVTRGHL